MLTFKDKPDTSTPINATNLNANFEELAEKVIDSSRSNNNDNYIKFVDGTMICWAITDTSITGGHTSLSDGLYVSDTKEITFPVAFVSTPVINAFISRNAGDINNIWVFVRSISETGFVMWSGRLTSSSGTGFYRGYIAVGKWK